MKYFFALFLILRALSVHAEFSVVAITGTTTANDCKGSATLRLNGDAGPFNVSIPETGYALSNVEGDIVLTDLCAGNYTIIIGIAQFPGCNKSLSFNIPIVSNNNLSLPSGGHLQSGNIDTDTKLDLIDVQKNFKLFPNPSRGNISLEFQNMQQFPIEVLIFSDQGQRLLSQDFPANTFDVSLNLTRLPSGLYFIIARQEDGTFVQKSLVIKS
jgi:hypothetical protein